MIDARCISPPIVDSVRVRLGVSLTRLVHRNPRPQSRRSGNQPSRRRVKGHPAKTDIHYPGTVHRYNRPGSFPPRCVASYVSYVAKVSVRVLTTGDQICEARREHFVVSLLPTPLRLPPKRPGSGLFVGHPVEIRKDKLHKQKGRG